MPYGLSDAITDLIANSVGALVAAVVAGTGNVPAASERSGSARVSTPS